MVHLTIVKNAKTMEDTPESALIQLEKRQAAKVPFPPTCPVLVLDKGANSASTLYSGDVTAVYVAFDHGSGSCNNCYNICYKDVNGVSNFEVVSGERIRYALNCPIKVSSKADTNDIDESIEGSIKGFEIISEDDVPSFLYTVEVTATGSNGEEKTFRQRGISPEHIRFRDTSSDPNIRRTSYHAEFNKTSVVSLDEPKIQNYGTPIRTPTTPKVLHTGTFNPPTTPQTPLNRPSLFSAATSPQIISSCEETKSFMKCHPLPQPHPTHFQGDMKENFRIPDFSFLTNYAPMQVGMPEGTKTCVMCGENRNCNNGKSYKTKSMKSSTKYSEDSIVIPNQNKGLCTRCDVNIWVIKSSNVQVKWCKGCKVRKCTQRIITFLL